MKKTIRITVLTALLLTLSLASAGTMAGAKTKNGFTYKITKNQVKIVSCSKNQKRIVIPNKIAGKKSDITRCQCMEEIIEGSNGCITKVFENNRKKTGRLCMGKYR